MSKHKRVDDCRTYGDYEDCLSDNGATRVRQNGSHVVWRKGDSTFVIPDHGHREVSVGVRHQLAKLMKAAGIVCILLALGGLAYIHFVGVPWI